MIARRTLLAATLAQTVLSLGGAQAQTPARTAAVAPRILAFGDSLTAGFGLPGRQGLIPQLQADLARRGSGAQLVNAGLSGDTTYGGRVRIALSLRRQAPDAVMVELGGNDMLLRWQPQRSEANLDAILSRAGAGGRPLLLVGIHAPGGAAEWRRGWAAIWPRLAKRHGALVLPDLYAPLAALPRDRLPAYLQRDGIHPSAMGVQLLVDHLGPSLAQLAARIG